MRDAKLTTPLHTESRRRAQPQTSPPLPRDHPRGTWGTCGTQQPGGVGRVELALAPSNPNVLYVSIQDAYDQNHVGHDLALLGLWKTTNAWDPAPSWTQIDVRQTDDGTGLYGI